MKSVLLSFIYILISISISGGVEYDPFKFTFYTKKIKGKTFEEVSAELEEKLNEVNLPVLDRWDIQLHREDFEEVKGIIRYRVILACNIRDRDELITRTPVISNLIPCTINIYETEKGEIYISILNEKLFLVRYKKHMLPKDIKRVKAVYMRIRCVIREVAL